MDNPDVVTAKIINGLDTDAIRDVIEDVTIDPQKGMVGFSVRSAWQGRTRSETMVGSYTLGGVQIPRSFRIRADEPIELFGTNTAPNPQELLMAALNACIMVGYVAGAAMQDITLEKVEIETTGQLDLRGFLGISNDVPPGYESLHYTVWIKGNGTPEQFRAIHETVMKTSPNYFNISRPIRIDSEIVIEE